MFVAQKVRVAIEQDSTNWFCCRFFSCYCFLRYYFFMFHLSSFFCFCCRTFVAFAVADRLLLFLLLWRYLSTIVYRYIVWCCAVLVCDVLCVVCVSVFILRFLFTWICFAFLLFVCFLMFMLLSRSSCSCVWLSVICRACVKHARVSVSFVFVFYFVCFCFCFLFFVFFFCFLLLILFFSFIFHFAHSCLQVCRLQVDSPSDTRAVLVCACAMHARASVSFVYVFCFCLLYFFLLLFFVFFYFAFVLFCFARSCLPVCRLQVLCSLVCSRSCRASDMVLLCSCCARAYVFARTHTVLVIF